MIRIVRPSLSRLGRRAVVPAAGGFTPLVDGEPLVPASGDTSGEFGGRDEMVAEYVHATVQSAPS